MMPAIFIISNFYISIALWLYEHLQIQIQKEHKIPDDHCSLLLILSLYMFCVVEKILYILYKHSRLVCHTKIRSLEAGLPRQ